VIGLDLTMDAGPPEEGDEATLENRIDAVWKACERVYRDTGRRILFTGLGVTVAGSAEDAAARDRRSAEALRALERRSGEVRWLAGVFWNRFFTSPSRNEAPTLGTPPAGGPEVRAALRSWFTKL
jgi:hypothetical protein